VDKTALGGEIIALGDDALYVASLDEKKFKKAQEDLKNGLPVDEVLDEAKTVIPYDQMHKVESNVHHRFIDVNWKPTDRSEKTDTNLLPGSKEARDEIMEGLRQRLGWEQKLIQFGRLRASLAPLVLIVLFGGIATLFLLAMLYPDKGSGGGTVVVRGWLAIMVLWVYETLGAIGVILIASPFVLGGVIWLVMRMITPPLMLTLTPAGHGKKRK
jgi:hypothetical protein